MQKFLIKPSNEQENQRPPRCFINTLDRDVNRKLHSLVSDIRRGAELGNAVRLDPNVISIIRQPAVVSVEADQSPQESNAGVVRLCKTTDTYNVHVSQPEIDDV